VPTTIKAKTPKGRFAGEWFLIGVSNDRGEHWKFVDVFGKRLNAEQLKTIFPAVADRLRLPEHKHLLLRRVP
jgi:hypothetical protein